MFRDMWPLWIILIGAVIALAVFVYNPPKSDDIVSRYVDREAGVVCWTYQRGISCLPIEATTLQR